MKNPKLSISFYAKPTSQEMKLIMCAVSFGQRKGLNVHPSVSRIITSEITGKPLRYESTYRKVIFSTGLSLPNSFWEHGKAIGIYEKKYKYNQQLADIKHNVQLLWESTNKEGLTVDKFKEKIKKHFVNKDGGKEFTAISTKDIPFYQFIQNEITEAKNLQQVTKIEDSTLNAYTSFGNTYKQFSQTITVDEINEENIKAFFIWRAKQGFGDHVMHNSKLYMRKFLRLAIKNKLNRLTNDDVLNMDLLQRIAPPKNEVTYLTVEELDQLQNAPLKDLSNTHKIVRDLFVVAAWSGGKRISDYNNFELKVNGGGRMYLENTSEKTDTYTKVPAFKRVIKIYRKYGNKFPKLPSEFNIKLAEVIKDAGIEKHVTSHTARRSFASNMIHVYNMNPLHVMVFGGWSNLQMMQRYIGLDKETLYRSFDKMLRDINE